MSLNVYKPCNYFIHYHVKIFVVSHVQLYKYAIVVSELVLLIRIIYAIPTIFINVDYYNSVHNMPISDNVCDGSLRVFLFHV